MLVNTSLIQPIFRPATNVRTAQLLMLTSLVLSILTNIQSSEFSLTDSTLIEEVVHSKFQLPPLTSKELNSQSKSPWAKRPLLIKYVSAGSPSHPALPVSYPTEVKSQKDNSQDQPAKTSAAPFINLLILYTVSILSPLSVEKESLSLHKSVKISSSQSAHQFPSIVSQLFILQLDPIPQKSVPTVELKISSMETCVLPHAQLELSLTLIKMEVLPVDHAQQHLD